MKLTQLDRIEAKLDMFQGALVRLLYGDNEGADQWFKQYSEMFSQQVAEHHSYVKESIELEKEEQNGVDKN